jgi:hypothetical protein
VTAEGLLATRLPRLLDEDDPELAAAAAWVLPASGEATAATDEPAAALLARLRAMRLTTITRLQAIPDAAWARPGPTRSGAGPRPAAVRLTLLSVRSGRPAASTGARGPHAHLDVAGSILTGSWSSFRPPGPPAS